MGTLSSVQNEDKRPVKTTSSVLLPNHILSQNILYIVGAKTCHLLKDKNECRLNLSE